MPQIGFSVTPQSLKESANVINEKTARYESEVAKIYSDIAELRVNWKGQTSDYFNQQLESYRNDFLELAKILKDYASKLVQATDNYVGTDARLAGDAQKLKTGK